MNKNAVDQTIGDMAYKALEAYRIRFDSYRDAAYGGAEAEAIHQMRVNARRMRACLRAFQPVLSQPLRELEPELKWIATALGEVRDIDVQMERLADVSDLLAELRGARRDQLRRDLDSPRYVALSEALRCRIAVGAHDDPSLAASPVVTVVPEIASRAYRPVARAAAKIDESSDAALIHSLRKKAKRLRYTVDCFADLYGKPAKSFIAALKDLQDLLGAYQDAIVAQGLCSELLGRGCDKELEDYAAVAQEEANQLRESLANRIEALAVRWAQLKRRMNRERRAIWKPSEG